MSNLRKWFAGLLKSLSHSPTAGEEREKTGKFKENVPNFFFDESKEKYLGVVREIRTRVGTEKRRIKEKIEQLRDAGTGATAQGEINSRNIRDLESSLTGVCRREEAEICDQGRKVFWDERRMIANAEIVCVTKEGPGWFSEHYGLAERRVTFCRGRYFLAFLLGEVILESTGESTYFEGQKIPLYKNTGAYRELDVKWVTESLAQFTGKELGSAAAHQAANGA